MSKPQVNHKFFNEIAADEIIRKILEHYPESVTVKDVSIIDDSKISKYILYRGEIVLTSDSKNFELGKIVYYYNSSYSQQDLNGEIIFDVVSIDKILHDEDVSKQYRVYIDSDSTSELTLDYFKFKRVYEIEKQHNYPFIMIWALNRVDYLMNRRGWKGKSAIEMASKRFGVSYPRLYEGYSRRQAVRRWAKEDYDKYLKSLN